MFSFLFCGQKGSGKEYVARKLNECLFSSQETFRYFNCESISLEALVESLNKGLFCTLYFDNFDHTDGVLSKFFETMVSEGYVLDGFGSRVWCKHCCIILSSVKEEAASTIGFDGAKDLKKQAVPFVDSSVLLKKVDRDVLNRVAVERSIKIIHKITQKFPDITVSFTEDKIAKMILEHFGNNITLDSLDSEISSFLSDKLCDLLVEMSSTGGNINIDEILKEQDGND